ncbi:MAG: PD-(D/E)XK nuclease family protein, partial [Gammaproteobacteria bacterium]
DSGTHPVDTAATPASDCLDATFGPADQPPVERARAFAQQVDTPPLAGRLSILPADSAEQEARAIDLQVRRWLLEDRQPVGIVTEDRRLARRVRALLERAGITLQDTGGWALSTTSAAAALECWLQTVEEDFAHQPLLAVLKSPFIFPDDDREELDSTVYRFEQDIVQHENIARGLERYRKHIGYRLQRLNSPWSAATAAALQILLNRLDQAAEPLRAIVGREPHPPAAILERLQASLQALGMWAAFETDPAGRRILQEWQLLHSAARHSGIGMDWLEFRAWLGTALERHVFRPATSDHPVLLLTLQQAQLGQFAGLVIGACDHEHLPAATQRSPFFNDPVRRDLGLPVWPDHYNAQLHRFRRLLESAPAVLLTWHQEDNGDTRLPSSWLEAIQTFHQAGWGDDLINHELEVLLRDPATGVHGDTVLPVPKRSGYPAPVLPAEFVPRKLSASSHQQLVDCPYRFYAAHGLGLKPRETIREALEKSDYGERIHFCLEIFHQGRAGFPGPFTRPFSLANRAAAIVMLEQIAQAVFARDLEDNFEHRAWLRRWQVLIPEYVDWQIQRQTAWQFASAEQQLEVMLDHDTSIRGRLDRIDSSALGIAVIDYKTGAPPGQREVDSGEAVQLPSYALLTDTTPARVEYLKLDDKVAGGAILEGESLAALAGAVRERALELLAAIEAGTPLPAWGDPKTCRYCEMDGVCRQQAWQEEADPPS